MSEDSLVTYVQNELPFTDQEIMNCMELLSGGLDENYQRTVAYHNEQNLQQNNQYQANYENLDPQYEELQPFEVKQEEISYPPTPLPTPHLSTSPPKFSTGIGNVVSNKSFAGDYEFNVNISTYHGSKAPFVFSQSLFKLFAKMNENVPIDICFNQNLNGKLLYVRAMPIYSHSAYIQESVTRCLPHMVKTDPLNDGIDENVRHHIVRCQDPAAIYEGDPNKKERLSVKVPLHKPQVGNISVRYLYKFMCKNSCTSGMNRRAVEIIFTLEDEYGAILGRKAVNLRVCSCPKRDKDKEENDWSKVVSNPITAAPPEKKKPTKGCKRKSDKHEVKPNAPSFTGSRIDRSKITLSIPIIGKKNARKVLEYAQNLMTGEMYKNGVEEPFRECYVEIGRQIALENSVDSNNRNDTNH